MDKVSFKTVVIVFFVSLLLFVITSPLTMVGIPYAVIASCVIFQSFTLIVCNRFGRKCKPVYLFIAILLGSSTIDLSMRAFYFEYMMLSLPISLGKMISIMAGYLVYKTQKG